MNVTIPDSLMDFVEHQASSGRYANPDAFVADLLRTEAEMLERAGRGEPFPFDEMLDEAETSEGYVGATTEDFDAMERETLELLRKRQSS